MECPACNNSLTEVNVSGVKVDICKGGCGGIWFDKFEFKKFDEPHEAAGAELLEIPLGENVVVNMDEKRACPCCDGVTMMRHFFSPKQKVEIDECANCAGVWLDTGELIQIRSLYNNEQEKTQAAEALFEDVFGEDLKELKAEREKDLEKARRTANMLKFICPSYYVKGNQDWGAF